MVITIINMYRVHDAENFTFVVPGSLTNEQREAWRSAHLCDDHDPDPVDGCPNNMFFRTVTIGESQEPVAMFSVDGENLLS